MVHRSLSWVDCFPALAAYLPSSCTTISRIQGEGFKVRSSSYPLNLVCTKPNVFSKRELHSTSVRQLRGNSNRLYYLGSILDSLDLQLNRFLWYWNWVLDSLWIWEAALLAQVAYQHLKYTIYIYICVYIHIHMCVYI